MTPKYPGEKSDCCGHVKDDGSGHYPSCDRRYPGRTEETLKRLLSAVETFGLNTSTLEMEELAAQLQRVPELEADVQEQIRAVTLAQEYALERNRDALGFQKRAEAAEHDLTEARRQYSSLSSLTAEHHRNFQASERLNSELVGVLSRALHMFEGQTWNDHHLPADIRDALAKVPK